MTRVQRLGPRDLLPLLNSNLAFEIMMTFFFFFIRVLLELQKVIQKGLGDL